MTLVASSFKPRDFPAGAAALKAKRLARKRILKRIVFLGFLV
jgi:hypothetical protein